MDIWQSIPDSVPFLGLAAAARSDEGLRAPKGKASQFKVRMWEAALITVFTSGTSIGGTVAFMQSRIDGNDKTLSAVQSQLSTVVTKLGEITIDMATMTAQLDHLTEDRRNATRDREKLRDELSRIKDKAQR